jgi:hypothetical protein
MVTTSTSRRPPQGTACAINQHIVDFIVKTPFDDEEPLAIEAFGFGAVATRRGHVHLSGQTKKRCRTTARREVQLQLPHGGRLSRTSASRAA